ncbi:hypothetical protein MFRU_016g00970 [Monilinia fructicola]|nr:hypothetical protein MFRU_016g00970 [Monilinia fructicola]
MDDNGGYGQEVTERESSSAEMVAIHQAMMEELGISRKYALPLEDKAGPIPTVPLVVPIKRVRPDNPVSIWHNLNLDDNEPGVEDLDDIAGGQLYRLRRGGSGLSNSGRGGHSASRGRGGASNRGAHVSAGGRGNSAARGRDVDSSKFGEPRFNDTKRGGKSHAAVDAGIARLQREAEFSRISRTEDRSIKVSPLASRSAKSAVRSAAPAVARDTPPGVNRPIASRFKLAPPEAFLSHNNIGCNPTGRVVQPVISITPPNTGDGLSEPAPSSKLAPHGGLAASRWASPAPKLVDTSESNNLEQFAAPETPTSTFAPGDFADSIVPATGSKSSEPNNLEHFAAPETPTSTFAPGDFADSIVPATGSNSSEPKYNLLSATSALPANYSGSNHYDQSTVTGALTIVTNGLSAHNSGTHTVIDEKPVKVSNNKVPARLAIARLIKFDEKSPLTLEIQSGNDIILREVLTEAATLKADTNIVTYQADSTTERKTTWRLQFQLPGPALGFVNYHTFKLAELRRNGCSSRSFGQGNQSSSIPISPVPSSAISTSSNATSRNDLAYFANRISSATFADLSQLNGEAMLFSLGEGESQAEDDQPPTYSSFQDLLSLMEVDVVEGTLQVLNAEHGGSFFDHVSQLAKGIGLENDADFMKHAKNVFIGGLSSSRYSRSKPILSITEELVSDFLSKSDTLQKFPREYIDTYTKEISKKILDKAQNPQNPAQSKSFNSTESLNTETVQLIDVTEVLKPVTSVAATKPVPAIKTAVVIESVGTSNLVPRQERRTYSIDEMIQMRPGAKLSREVLAARDSLAKYLPHHKREIAPADIIQTTASGLRIVAGRNHGPRYRDSHRATAAKLQPSEWKAQFANSASNQEDPQAFEQDKNVEEQTSEQSSFVPALLHVGSTGHVSSDDIDLQDSSNLASSKVTEVINEGISDGALASISVEHKMNKSSADICHQSFSGHCNGVSSIAIQAQNNNVSNTSTTEEESEVTVKVESERNTTTLSLPTNRGLGTSRYATPEVVSQKAVLRAASGYKPPPHQTVKSKDLSSISSVPSKSLRSTELHNTASWETLLLSKQMQPSIKVERPETPKNEPGFEVDTASKLEQIPEFKTAKGEEALGAVIENAEWTTVDKATKQKAEAVGSQNDNTDAALEKITEQEVVIPEFDRQLPTGGKNVATDSEIDVLAQVLSNLEVKTERNNNAITDDLPAPERSTSPTIEEILEKKRANGLATSKWAGPQSTVFKPARHIPQSTSSDNSQSGFNKLQYNGVFYPQNSQYSPAIQAQSPYGGFSQHGNQYSTLQGQSSSRVFPPEADQPYPVQHMQSQQSIAPVLSTILFTNSSTGEVSEMTGILQRTHVPVATQMPSAYLEQSPASAIGFTASPSRPTMLGKSFSDPDSEDVLNATAPVFTPSRQRNASAMALSALSPVYHRQNAQQEAIQARLNKSLAEQRM